VTFECSDLLDMSCETNCENDYDILRRSLCPRKRREILLQLEKAGLEIFDLLDREEPILDLSSLAFFTVSAPEGSQVESQLEKLRERIRGLNPEMSEFPEEVKCALRVRLEAFFNFCCFSLPPSCAEHTYNLLQDKDKDNTLLPQKRAAEETENESEFKKEKEKEKEKGEEEGRDVVGQGVSSPRDEPSSVRKEDEAQIGGIGGVVGGVDAANAQDNTGKWEPMDEDKEMQELRQKRRDELTKRKRVRDEYSGKYRALKCDRELQDFRGFSQGLCLLHDREDMEDALHVALSALASRHPDVFFGHLHQRYLTIEELKQEPKPCLIKFVDGEMDCQASAAMILDMFTRATSHHTFSLALEKELEAFVGLLNATSTGPDYPTQTCLETPHGDE